ncbi:tetratricopeptide repeat protein [Brevundimonas sp. 2R-24]|uniref:Tetratricopeptide repeat protein n=1 Tax=Peiella sedimenti TaxID=3061083 RepID=A0ABT8SNP7_9CAUL|nr:tetratricopeptide repeat protein [Caulobacteraceae bacterium XZ-24]
MLNRLSKLKSVQWGTLAATVTGVLFIGATVVAQTEQLQPIEWDKRRLDRLDRNVRRLERALFQRNAAGEPLILEPDPEVIALQGRVELMDRRIGDLEGALRRVNGSVDDLTTELVQTRRQSVERQRDIDALRTRTAELESELTALKEANAEPPAPTSPTGEPGADFTAAMQALRAQDWATAVAAFDTFIAVWPDADQIPEAHFRLGQARAGQGDQAGAAQAYAAALRGWPRTSWAPEATVNLATALHAGGRTQQACAAIGEFERRYAQAPQALRQRVAALKTRAACAA